MKELILVRHAKSSWEYAVDDFHRPLLEKGIRRAQRMSTKLQQKLNGKLPELWMSSPANRALHTAVIFAETFDAVSEIQLNPALYTFGFHSLLGAVKGLDNSKNRIIIFTHNEGLTHFVNEMGTEYSGNMPTASVACIHFGVDDWRKIEKGETQFILYPEK